MNTLDHTLTDVFPHRDMTIDFTSISGKNLRIRVSLILFDNLSLKTGNNYKAGCWVVARCNEVEGLSIEAIERYINMVTRQKCQKVVASRIDVREID